MSHQEGICFTKQISMVSSARTEPSQSASMALLLLPLTTALLEMVEAGLYFRKSVGFPSLAEHLMAKGLVCGLAKPLARLALLELRPLLGFLGFW
ncbi:hypothetical protein LOK49_LG03G02549 [Camellia lanceoleosa]|uniref:Uncharacterized protein n=1 Tax=Camellia lanceoleosa TaxID=1840588 RepID=A0ACC0I4Z4_9ERIC|nr:hypothetical protein LOK49_LG03G02549 [Camellia lanceoleosa]